MLSGVPVGSVTLQILTFGEPAKPTLAELKIMVEVKRLKIVIQAIPLIFIFDFCYFY